VWGVDELAMDGTLQRGVYSARGPTGGLRIRSGLQKKEETERMRKRGKPPTCEITLQLGSGGFLPKIEETLVRTVRVVRSIILRPGERDLRSRL